MNVKNFNNLTVINTHDENNNCRIAKTIFGASIITAILSLTACQTVSTTRTSDNISSSTNNLTSNQQDISKLVKGNAQKLIIFPDKVSCNTKMPMQCMLAIIEGNTADTAFKIPFRNIVGFTPKANIYYKINAHPLIDENQTKPTGRWYLDSILLQTDIRHPSYKKSYTDKIKHSK